MINYSNSSKLSIQFCESIFNKVKGRALIKLGGEFASYDKTRKEVFIRSDESKTIYMPAGSFMKHLSDDEIVALDSLPIWNGSNERELSLAVLAAATNAIARFKAKKIRSSTFPEDYFFFVEGPFFIESVVDCKVQRLAVFH